MAAGYGFTEDLPMDEGKILNPNLVDYMLLRATEMPETTVMEVETYEPEGPFGAKEAGEGLTNPTAGALGNAVHVDHGDGQVTVYAHLSRVSVQVGELVQRGKKVGEVGHTGKATGNHIHYEVRVNGRAVNPMPFIGS